MRIEQTKTRQELIEVRKAEVEKEKESKKLLQGAKREVIKMQSRIDALKHDVKKMETENQKLKHQLKQKLNNQNTAPE